MVAVIPLRHRWRALATCAVFATLLGTPASVVAVDNACLQSAIADRTNQLQTAYNDYARDMQRIASDYGSRENNALSNGDINYQMNEINRANSEYANNAAQISYTLNIRVSQLWASYQSRRASCGAGAVGIPNYQYAPSSYSPYSYGGYGASGYPYSYSNYQTSNCQYGNASYPYYSYPYNYNYSSTYGNYSYPYSSNYNYSYRGQGQRFGGTTYSYNGQVVCSQPILNNPLPPGCGYDCELDSNQCRSCTISCRSVSNPRYYNGCGCSTTYRPVCGRDEITYVSECYADCAGVEVRHTGVCH